VHLVDVLRRVADAAFVHELFQVSFAEETADGAHMDAVGVGDIEQSLLEEPSTSVRNHAVTLHFSEPKATITRTTFSRLSGQDLSRSSATGVDLVSDHMLQSLVIGRSQENHDLESLSSEPTVHSFVSVSLVPEVVQSGRNFSHSLTAEGSSVAFISIQTDHFGK